MINSRFTFLRDYFWVLSECYVELPQDDTIRNIKNEYEQLERGKIPLLKSSISESTLFTDKNKQYHRIESHVVKIIPGPAPLSEFEVSQFLPPQTTVGVQTAIFSWYRIFCIGIGLLFLIISISLKIKFRKKYN
ncbi:MAG: hypothetical protein LBJ00_03140 [Planctomycetaceae bacterium]|nr:hypothetical protein [Planctomycetaceae bacterium]